MSTRAFDDREMTGYLLPEDGQRLLKRLSSHIRFLARLAQPRIADETTEWAPVVGMAEWVSCLDQMAEQLELVLKEVSCLERSPSVQASRATLATTEEKDDEKIGRDTDEEDGASKRTHRAEANDQPPVLGVTLDQYDELRLLVASIKAFGDAVFADASADFAAGTLSMLGFTIFDRAVEMDDILKEIDARPLAQGTRLRFAVEEPRAAYGVEAPREVGQVPWTGAASASASVVYGPLLGGASVH